MSDTKIQRRRAGLLSEHWLRFHASPRHPRFAAKNVRKHLKIRSAGKSMARCSIVSRGMAARKERREERRRRRLDTLAVQKQLEVPA